MKNDERNLDEENIRAERDLLKKSNIDSRVQEDYFNNRKWIIQLLLDLEKEIDDKF